MNSRTISTKLGDIEFRSIGNGIPIVFIHGGHSNCNETLSHKGFDIERFRLITPSRPGYGTTPLYNNFTAKKAADLIAELLVSLSISKAIIYGISAGGFTAIEFAARHPDKVEKLILASAVSKKWLDPKDQVYRTAHIIFHPKIEGVVWGLVGLFSKVFPRMIANSFYSQFSTNQRNKLRKKDITELVLALRKYRSKKGFLNDINQTVNVESLQKIKAPCLVIHSKNDNSVSFDHALHSHQMIKNSILAKLNNEWGHLFWVGRDSEESIKKILDFINEETPEQQ